MIQSNAHHPSDIACCLKHCFCCSTEQGIIYLGLFRCISCSGCTCCWGDAHVGTRVHVHVRNAVAKVHFVVCSQCFVALQFQVLFRQHNLETTSELRRIWYCDTQSDDKRERCVGTEICSLRICQGVDRFWWSHTYLVCLSQLLRSVVICISSCFFPCQVSFIWKSKNSSIHGFSMWGKHQFQLDKKKRKNPGNGLKNQPWISEMRFSDSFSIIFCSQWIFATCATFSASETVDNDKHRNEKPQKVCKVGSKIIDFVSMERECRTLLTGRERANRRWFAQRKISFAGKRCVRPVSVCGICRAVYFGMWDLPMRAFFLSVSASFSTTFCVWTLIISFVFSVSLKRKGISNWTQGVGKMNASIH